MRGQARREQRRGHDEGPAAQKASDGQHHVAVGQRGRAAELVDLADALVAAQHAAQRTQRIVERDRLGAGLHPARGDHHRQPLDELSQDLPADAAVPDDDAGPERGRRGRVAQDDLDLATAAKVLRQVVAVGPQAAQVDDLVDPAGVRGLAEVARRDPVLLGEVRFGQRMDEVVRRVLSGHRRAHARRVLYIRSDRGAGAEIARRAAGHGRHLVTLIDEDAGQRSTDEAGRAGDQHPHRRSAPRSTSAVGPTPMAHSPR